MIKAIRATVFASMLLMGSYASADVVFFDIFPESNPPNDCAGYYSNPNNFSSCIIYAEDLGQGDGNVSSVIAKYDVEEDEWEVSTFWPDFDETLINLNGTVEEDAHGSWSYAGDEILFWVVKSATGFRVFYFADDDTCVDGIASAGSFGCMSSALHSHSGDWWTISEQGISHITFYNGEVVAEPGTLALLGLGLLGMGLRRRRKVIA